MKPQRCIARDDCLRACIASILGTPANTVPNFVAEVRSEENPADLAKDWLRERGLSLFTQWCEGEHWSLGDVLQWFSSANPGIPMILSGRSVRDPDGHHAVVVLDGAIVHDPSDAGISGPCLDTHGKRRWFVEVIALAHTWTAERVTA